MAFSRRAAEQEEPGRVVGLPRPSYDGEVSLQVTLRERQSVREFTRGPLTLAEVSQLLWAAQGVTRPDGGRTVPSAGALYPLEFYLVVGHVEHLPDGVYRYRPASHDLVAVSDRDQRGPLARAAVRQTWMQDAAVVVVLAAVYGRTTGKYGDRGRKYVHMEVGCAAQNIYLEAAALGLGTTLVGAFHDNQVKEILGLPASEQALGLMPVGRR